LRRCKAEIPILPANGPKRQLKAKAEASSILVQPAPVQNLVWRLFLLRDLDHVPDWVWLENASARCLDAWRLRHIFCELEDALDLSQDDPGRLNRIMTLCLCLNVIF
jgi:hypothetical protein